MAFLRLNTGACKLILLLCWQALQNLIRFRAECRKYLYSVWVLLIGYVIHIAVGKKIGFVVAGVGPHDGDGVCTLFFEHRAENPVDIILIIDMVAHLMQEHERIADPDVDRLFPETVQAFDEADGEFVQPVVVIDDLIAVPVEVQPDGL